MEKVLVCYMTYCAKEREEDVLGVSSIVSCEDCPFSHWIPEESLIAGGVERVTK